MKISAAIRATIPEVWLLGTTPPPVTGMTLFTEQIVERLHKAGPTVFCNWSPGNLPRGLRFRAERLRRAVGSLAKLLWHGCTPNGRLYIAANSESGLWLTALAAYIGHRNGFVIYLHHHTYYYIDEYDGRMAWIDRLLGGSGVHVVHCEQMERDFRATYPTRCDFAYIYPSVVSMPLRPPRTAPNTPFRIGHLGNLSTAKGLDLVLGTFGELKTRGRCVTLKLAGPCHAREASRLVERAVAHYGDSVDYAGPLYGEQKAKFFDGIDCFLFPSRSESWGIVLNEAMASGVPVIAHNRGCAETLVGERAGVLIDQESEFVENATREVGRWIDDAEAYVAASQAARIQADELHRVANLQLDEFARLMFGRTDTHALESTTESIIKA